MDDIQLEMNATSLQMTRKKKEPEKMTLLQAIVFLFL